MRNGEKMFRVQNKLCKTCIYRADLFWDLEKFEAQVKDEYVGFKSFRVCHHSKNACCRGFWNAHKDHFQLGQLAQRLGSVEFVDDDVLL